METAGFEEGMGREEVKAEGEGRKKEETETVRGVCGAKAEECFENLEFSECSGDV